MIDKIKNHKKVAALGVIALLMAGGAAYAYWTTAGAGTGSATTGTSTPIVVHQTGAAITGLSPGGTPQALSGTLDNPNTGVVPVASVSATIGTVTGPNITGPLPCDATDYAIAGTGVVVTSPIPAGLASATWSGLTIAMLDGAGNQDGCKGATVPIVYTSN
jgi:hypothetical protein